MSEPVLTVLKFCFLALLYLFLFRVVRVVVIETKAPADQAPATTAKPKRADRKLLALRIVQPAPRQGERIAVNDDVTVGRAGGCTLVLADDSFVSQVHARVFRREGDTILEDLGSKNGTYVNGERVVAPTHLRKGDRIQFGETVAEVVR